VPRITRLRELPRSRVAIELDGSPWRTVPTEAVVRAGLAEGLELDRGRARQLRRELRRSEALEIASRTLARRDHSLRRLEERLRRAGVAPAARREAVRTLRELGAVDDGRFAGAAARRLADRAFGDAAIASYLEQLGVGADETEAALAALAPEPTRVQAVVGRRGATPRTARYLARRGFLEDSVADVFGSRLQQDAGEV
jgi:SOS response regulatory protein OraA/RecX